MSDDGPRKTRLYGALEGAPTVGDSEELAVATDAIAVSRLERYDIEDVLGRGGMGEVLSARDDKIGRLVAIKRLRVVDPSEALVARFLREARIQGRLEHPAVVPVHELWHEPGGAPFFVMKQLAGVTLAEVVPRLAAGEPTALARFPIQRLLRAFADVCLALEFAHTRGVVHRDLKPANLMFGDFGEVYVLDWGIARVAGGEDIERASFADIHAVAADDATIAGAILGTPGYIAPEQIRAEPELDGRADVYALGCILFELLALQPLHPRGQAALGSALGGIDARPSVRAPDRVIPPELDAICVQATALERDDRFPTARALSDAIQHYLDGDRDLALRKQLAGAELAAAHKALVNRDDPTARRDAMRAAARALALDPTDRAPADLVGSLMLEAPRDTPPEVERELERLDEVALRSSARFGKLAGAAFVFFFAMLYAIGFRELWYVITGPTVALAGVAIQFWLAPRRPYLGTYIAILGNAFVIGVFAWMVSPIVLGPGAAILMITLLAQHRRLIRTWTLATLAVFVSITPWLWQLAHGLRPFEVSGRDAIVHTFASHLDPDLTWIGLALYMVALPALAALLSSSQHDELREVRRTLQLQSWQLRQLVPRPQGVGPSGGWVTLESGPMVPSAVVSAASARIPK